MLVRSRMSNRTKAKSLKKQMSSAALMDIMKEAKIQKKTLTEEEKKD